MGLGISVRHALVCAASKGLGKACAMALALEGGCLPAPLRRILLRVMVTGRYLLMDGGSYARTID